MVAVHLSTHSGPGPSPVFPPTAEVMASPFPHPGEDTRLQELRGGHCARSACSLSSPWQC